MKSIAIIVIIVFAQLSFVFGQEVPSNELPQTIKDVSAQPATPAYIRPDSKTRLKRYLKSAFGKGALTRTAIGSGIGQISDSPEEWKRTSAGFGKRAASNYAQGAISSTITFGLNEAFKLDNNFEKSGKKGFGKRLKHVLIGSITARTKKGGYVPDFPQLVGSYASNIIAREAWYPKSYTYRDGLKSGTISIFSRLGMNFLREFVFK